MEIKQQEGAHIPEVDVQKKAPRSHWVKIVITITVLCIVVSSVPMQEYHQALTQLSFNLIISVLLLVFLQVFLLACRWNLLAKTAGSTLSIKGSVFGVLISYFFSQGLPASVGADAFRIWWHKREGITTSNAFKIIFFDRICGMLSLVLLCISSFFLLTYYLNSHDKLISVFLFISIVGITLASLFLPWRFGISQKLIVLAEKSPNFFRKVLHWMVGTRDSLRKEKISSVLFLLGIGITVHVLAVIQVFIVGYAISPESITFLKCLAVVPLAFFVSYMPFSIAGWGVREASMVIAFGLLGLKASTAILISLIIGVAIFMISLLGGAIWMLADFGASYASEMKA